MKYYIQHNGTVIRDICTIMNNVNHIIAQDVETGLGNHKVVDSAAAFDLSPRLKSSCACCILRFIAGIQKMLCDIIVSYRAFLCVEVAHNDSGQITELRNFVQHNVDTVDAGFVTGMIQMGVEHNEIFTG